jgi:hypothetical protein
MAARATAIAHRTRYLALLKDLRRRTLDAQREWLDLVSSNSAADNPAPAALLGVSAQRWRTKTESTYPLWSTPTAVTLAIIASHT